MYFSRMAPTRNAQDDEAQELGQDGQTGMRRDGPGTLVISPTIVVPRQGLSRR